MRKEQSYCDLFSGIDVPVKLQSGEMVIPINFDNAATTPALRQVDQFVYENILMYGSVGRGGHKSSYCTNAYEISKEEVLKFFGIHDQDDYTVLYVKNTTEGLNLLATILCDRNRQKVLTTRMEHHANDLPWRRDAHVFYCEVNEEGKLDLEEVEHQLCNRLGTIQYVAVTAVSNVTGHVNPVHQIAKLAHRYGAKIIVDAAQMVAHKKIQMKGQTADEDIDFLVFSGHKMYAPFGSGVIIGRKKEIEDKEPFITGGGGVTLVFDDDVYYKALPYKEEAGTPNFLGAMSIVAAMTVLNEIGYEAIEAHEHLLRDRLIKGLMQIPKVRLYGDVYDADRVGVIPFNIEGIHCNKVGQMLQDIRGIAVRTGCFCAHPYVMRLLSISDEERYKYLKYPQLERPGMVRASFGLYNTTQEVDEFLEIIRHIAK